MSGKRAVVRTLQAGGIVGLLLLTVGRPGVLGGVVVRMFIEFWKWLTGKQD